MEKSSDQRIVQVRNPKAGVLRGHPWAQAADLEIDSAVADGTAVDLVGPDGRAFGSGIFDRRDPSAAWRRFSWAEGTAFDADYIATAIQEAFARRADEPCRRLVSSDADYLPGLIVE